MGELHEDLYCKFVIVHSQSGVTPINKNNKCQKYIHEKNVKKLKKREKNFKMKTWYPRERRLWQQTPPSRGTVPDPPPLTPRICHISWVKKNCERISYKKIYFFNARCRYLMLKYLAFQTFLSVLMMYAARSGSCQLNFLTCFRILSQLLLLRSV